MSELGPLIEQAKRTQHPFVVVTIDDEGIRWMAESKGACECIADLLGNCKVMPREEFISTLEELEATHD